MTNATRKTEATARSRKNKRVTPKTYASRLLRQEHGPCTVIRAVTQHYPSLKRRDVLAIARDLNLSEGTASQQFNKVRNGGLRVKL